MVTQDMVDWMNRVIYKMWYKPPSKIITTGDVDTKPTQRDKPSPSSHFTKAQLLKRKAREYPTSSGFSRSLVANTNSMEPFIDDNTVVTSEMVHHRIGKRYITENPIRVGDICVYKADPAIWGPDVRIIHMVEKIRNINGKREYQFRGYNNFMTDPGWVKHEDIILRCFDFASAEQQRVGD